ncbi:sugar diacid recognition domain-containing protein [Nocardiopsis sp. N85]|uniref:CdaR family transcriptional regulator n=1 Tax=Nocardiopsis sp. N85 TaxID=3029400 RepID=UPI00237F3952|nr:sugar diacid recognition domain-containing protein [Nocardiopsis sp. N85]MDE3725030.1 sugar diacid recognition domain-containing protein [Nocardiopsis sp. N85]
MAENAGRTPLSGALAQRVVDLIAPTISHNINVMDEHGTIIACLDPERRGTLHRGAQRVIAEGRAVLIDSPEPGTSDRPGANEPLMIDGELRGVIGITGDPREVAPLARVVALSVRLLIAQEDEQDAATRRHTEARDLIAALTSGTSSAESARDRLAAAGLAPPWSLALWTAAEPRPDGAAAPPPLAESIAARLNTDHGRRAAVLHGALWSVGSGAAFAPPGVPSGVRHTATEPTDDIEVLLAHAEGSRALCRRVGLVPTAEDAGPWSRDIAVAVAHLPRRTLEHLAGRASALSEAQRRTLVAVASTTSMRAAADSVYVHRNTLLQRVERIRAVTGADIRRADHLAALRMALYAHEALCLSHTNGP